jgi:hypothetical protein
MNEDGNACLKEDSSSHERVLKRHVLGDGEAKESEARCQGKFGEGGIVDKYGDLKAAPIVTYKLHKKDKEDLLKHTDCQQLNCAILNAWYDFSKDVFKYIDSTGQEKVFDNAEEAKKKL